MLSQDTGLRGNFNIITLKLSTLFVRMFPGIAIAMPMVIILAEMGFYESASRTFTGLLRRTDWFDHMELQQVSLWEYRLNSKKPHRYSEDQNSGHLYM